MHEMIGFFSLRCTNTSTGEGVSVSSAFNTHTTWIQAVPQSMEPGHILPACPPVSFPCPLLAIREPHWVGLVFLGALLYAPPEIALL